MAESTTVALIKMVNIMDMGLSRQKKEIDTTRVSLLIICHMEKEEFFY